jgi:hypothetical protein
MTVHVLGHIVRAPTLALADLKQSPAADGRPVSGAAWRRSLIVASLIAGIALGVFALTQIGPWQHRGAVHAHNRPIAIARAEVLP